MKYYCYILQYKTELIHACIIIYIYINRMHEIIIAEARIIPPAIAYASEVAEAAWIRVGVLPGVASFP